MNEEHDPSESSYRPSSPDLSGFTTAPLPRLNRIPSYHAPDPNLPPGYSFSPRGSYDASPFFSPSTITTPSTSYFAARAHSATPQQTHSPQSFRTPNLPGPTQGPPPNQPRSQIPPYHHPTPSLYGQPPPRQSGHPTFNNLQYQQHTQHFAAQPPGVAHPYGDMPRTRQARAAEAMDPDYETDAAPGIPMPTKIEAVQQPLQSIMPTATTDPSHGIDVRTKFPVARIKRIMQADEDVGKVAQATPTAVSKALELFMITLVTKGAAEAKANHSKRVTAQHLKAALMKDGQFDFLTEICENVPDEGSKKGRAKSEAKSEDSEEDIGPKKKAKGGRKRKASDDDSD